MKKIKGFTLVELIIVMVILTIIMAALMNMMKPIRATYVDSTYYEAQRNTQNGMVQYLTESTRYATNLGVYVEGFSSSSIRKSGATAYSPESISDLDNAIKAFKDKTGVTDESKINIITIDNKTAYNYKGSNFYGRLLRCTADNTSKQRIALGEAYYGEHTYSINLVAAKSGGMKVSVSSIIAKSVAEEESVKTDTVNSKSKCVITESEVVCLNLSSAVKGIFDTRYSGTDKSTKDEDGTTLLHANTTTAGKNTYIIFTLPE